MKLRPCNDCPYFIKDGADEWKGACNRYPGMILREGALLDIGCGEHPDMLAEREETIGAARERGRLTARDGRD